MSFSNYLEDKILNWLRGTSMTPPAAVYVGLFSSDPSESGSGTEVTTTVRVAGRVAVTFGAPSSGSIANTAAVDFGTAAGAATVTHFGIFDAASSGNMLMSGALAANIAAGNLVSFAIGALTVSVD